MRVARGREPGVTVEQIAKDFGGQTMTLQKWLQLAADSIPVAVACRVSKLSRQPYHRWLAGSVAGSELVQAYRSNALFDAHRDDP